MNDLQKVLQLAKGLVEIARLEEAAAELAEAGWDEAEAERCNEACYVAAGEAQRRLESLGFSVDSAWGEDGDWSVRLDTCEKINGHRVPGPLIADCRMP